MEGMAANADACEHIPNNELVYDGKSRSFRLVCTSCIKCGMVMHEYQGI